MTISNNSAIALGPERWTAQALLTVVFLGLTAGVQMSDYGLQAVSLSAIQKSFAISDASLGALQGLAGVLVGSALAIPLARFADRFSRKRVLLCLILASTAMMVLSALAPNFPLFFLGRSAAGITEFAMVPLEGLLISRLGWQQALFVLAGLALLIMPLALRLREPTPASGQAAQKSQSLSQAIKEAMTYPSFLLLTAGYFVCGFQVVFIGVHMPAYLKDKGLDPQVASYALALIGLFNVFGTYVAGTLAQRIAKRKILAFIYIARAVVISIFLMLPVSPASVYIFSAVMGLLWLSTVPVTNASVAQIFGVAHLSMLSGFVFFSHQIGSFLGVWLGGLLYDQTGSYNIVWYLSIALGVIAALLNLPVREAPLARLKPKLAA